MLNLSKTSVNILLNIISTYHMINWCHDDLVKISSTSVCLFIFKLKKKKQENQFDRKLVLFIY